jgi:hypothetical protein
MPETSVPISWRLVTGPIPALCDNCRMGNAVAEAGKKGLALVILLGAAYVLFKIVLGVVTALAWVLIAVLAVAAIIWAIRVL